MNIDNIVYCLEEDKFFRCVDVPADGSCMFHSLSYLMFGNLDYSYELRRECCDIMEVNRNFLMSRLVWSESQMNDYLEKLADPTEYAGHLELTFIIRLYSVSIWIYQPISTNVIKPIFKEDHNSPNMILKLLYVRGNHYIALIDTDIDEMSQSVGTVRTAVVNEILNSLIISEEFTELTGYETAGSTLTVPITENSLDNVSVSNKMITADANLINDDDERAQLVTRSIQSDEIQNVFLLNDSVVGSSTNVNNNGVTIDDDFTMDIDSNNDVDIDWRNSHRHLARLEYNESKIMKHSLGEMKSQECAFCGAFYFPRECTHEHMFTKCCMRGKHMFDYDFDIPQLIKNLLQKTDDDGSHFKDNIRQYNAALAFASFGATIFAGSLPGRGPYVFKIQGIAYHLSSNLQITNSERKYSQLYFVDSNLANGYRLDRNPKLLLPLLTKLDNLLRTCNIYAKEFLNLLEREKLEIQRSSGSSHKPVEYSIWLLKNLQNDKNRYNLPTSDEVAAVFSSIDGCPPHLRDVEIHNRNGERIKLSICSQHTDPMVYPLFYPYGGQGWSINFKNRSGKNKITMANYYCYLLSVRNKFSAFLHGGKLTQQYIDDAYCKIEADRLNYYRRFQKNLRVEQYRGLHDYLKGRSERENFKIGKAVILPSSFPGSPRHMAQNFQDAMTMVSEFGKPDLFITFTCNPQWPEIVDNLEPYEKPSDRPDLVSRVFYEKFSAFVEELIRSRVLGHIIAYTFVFEWQKRGLPHAHFLGILAPRDKIYTSEDIDSIISAEIPDAVTQPRLFKIIERNMIHGPCGDRNKNSPCMNGGVCTKNYPKSFSDVTIFNDNGFPKYRRRDDGRSILIQRSNGTSLKCDNRDIVPYNPYLSARYDAHINVEICSTIKSVKYLFKYIYKGHSCISMTIRNSNEQCSDTIYNHDEINEHLNARYVGPCEAFHRIYGYELHKCSHCIYRLAVHLEDMQSVCFEEGTEEQTLMKDAIRRTTLTAWFELNQKDSESRQYLYYEIPKYYVWDKPKRTWRKRARTNKPLLGRMYNVNVREGERFFLRLLLLHKRGCTSFADVRTVDGIVYNTYREAALAMNLLNDDSTWYHTIAEAVQYQMPHQLRELFATICIFCEPCNPSSLWEKFEDSLIEDYIYAGDSKEVALEKSLFHLNNWFQVHGKNNLCFNLPLPNMSLIEDTIQRRDEIDNEYDLAEERRKGLEMMSMSNPEQLFIIKTVMHKLYPNENEWIVNELNNPVPADCHLFLINAAAGTGKTWIYNTIIHLIKSKGDVAIALAFTGIAASLLIDGRTLHSAAKLPLSLNETSVCGLTWTHPYAKLIKRAKLIIIDEISMCPRLALNALNRLFRELTNLQNEPFGLKTTLFGGDFMQTLPVVRHGSRVEIVSNTVIYSNDWHFLHTFHLYKNMRVRPHSTDYADWILKIGRGTLSVEQHLENDFIKIPSRCLVRSDQLINAVFGSHLRIIDLPQYKDKAILTPLNEDTFLLNEKILAILEGESKTYFSENSIAEDEDSENFTEISSEFLNSITPNGMPCHILILKRGAIVMLLRNLNTKKGLCNGTRLVITDMLQNVIKAEILTGTKTGTVVLIPRIVLYSSKDELPFSLKRKQFPIRLAFSITINKAQGQSYEKTGIYLPHPVFTHGQLYVAFSRARSFDEIIVSVDSFDKSKTFSSNDSNSQCLTKNIVFREIIMHN